MAKSRKGSRKTHRKGSRKSHRKGSRRQRGGVAPLNWSNPGPMQLNLAQGQQYAEYHKNQHGGMAPYPGGVVNSKLPDSLVASAHLLPLQKAFDDIRGLQDGGRRRRSTRKGSRKGRKGRKGHKSSRRQSGGLYRWGGGGGYNLTVDTPMKVGESSQMLIPTSLRAQAGLNPEWKLAENPMAFAPK